MARRDRSRARRRGGRLAPRRAGRGGRRWASRPRRSLFVQSRGVRVRAGRRAHADAGQPLGTIGYHGDFPHLHLAVASTSALGGDKDLIPEATKDALPEGDAAWNVQRVKVGGLDPLEWPGVPPGDYYVFNPIEFVRWLRGEEYVHDIGRAAPAKVTSSVQQSDPVEVKDAPGEHTVEHGLKSKLLAAIDKAVELIHHADFPPIEKGGGDAEFIKGVQRALKKIGYDVGRFGPDHDGVDGDFGKTMERVLKKFQEEHLAALDFSAFGKTKDDIRLDGVLDWLTLLGIDIVLAAHEAAGDKPPPAPPPKRDPPPAPPLHPPATAAPPAGAHVFDGQSKKQSLKFGMRMYKALLNWELSADGKSGARYSCASESFQPYVDNVPKERKPEWPDLSSLGIKATTTRDVGGKTYNVYKVFGVNWVGSHSTNCCNSQMAAMFLALSDGIVHIKGADGKIVDHDAQNLNTKTSTKTKKGGKASPRPTLLVFEQTFVSGMAFFDENDKPLQGDAGMASACKFLGIGDTLGSGKASTDQTDLKLARLGDLANYPGHAWLVGDVRYGIWFSDGKNKKAPDARCDQSSFIRSETGEIVAAGADDGPLMTAADCDWVAANEGTFETLVKNFLGASTLNFGGRDRPVAKIEVTNIRVFSANCIWGKKSKTSDGIVYDSADGTTWTANSDSTKKFKARLGVSRPWSPNMSQTIVFTRLFDHAG